MTYQLFVIDDHDAMRRALVRFLNGEANLNVCGEAASAREGLQRLETLTPDLVLVDMSMPEMNGVEFVTALHETKPTLPCLMVSAHAQKDYVRAALQAGARGYVMKEDPLDVLTAIFQVIGGKVYTGTGKV